MKKALFSRVVDSERRVTGVIVWIEISIAVFWCVDEGSVRVGNYRAGVVTELKLREIGGIEPEVRLFVFGVLLLVNVHRWVGGECPTLVSGDVDRVSSGRRVGGRAESCESEVVAATMRSKESSKKVMCGECGEFMRRPCRWANNYRVREESLR